MESEGRRTRADEKCVECEVQSGAAGAETSAHVSLRRWRENVQDAILFGADFIRLDPDLTLPRRRRKKKKTVCFA